MSWAQNPDIKISFTPGEGISFMLASDVALYKDIQVVRLADSAFISTAKRCSSSQSVPGSGRPASPSSPTYSFGCSNLL